MKSLIIAGSCLVLLFASCKKSNDSSSNPNTSAGTLVRIQQGTDADITNDTVYLIKYNSANKISSIVDSLNLDTLKATYDANNRLSSVITSWGYNASYTYDANGLLTQLSYTSGSDIERYTFEYTSGVLSKKSYYSNAGSGPLSLWNYFTYTVAGGNVSSMTQYSAGGTLQLTTTYTYGSQSNAFKDLCLFNFNGTLGSNNIIDVDTYFNTNMRATISENSSSSVTNTYTTSSSQQVTKAVSTEIAYGDVLTWMFTYK